MVGPYVPDITNVWYVETQFLFQNSETALVSRYESYITSMKSIVKVVIENLADGTVGYSNPFVTDNPEIYIGT